LNEKNALFLSSLHLHDVVGNTMFKVAVYDCKEIGGKGLKTLESIPKSAFVLEYGGERIGYEEGLRREQDYEQQKGSFMFLCHGKTKFWYELTQTHLPTKTHLPIYHSILPFSPS
jgi:hypothetical protein